MERYNVEYASQIPEVKEKVKITTMLHFGVEYIFQRKDIMKEANIKKFGKEWAMQSTEVSTRSGRTLKEGYLSGRIKPNSANQYGQIYLIDGYENRYKSSWEVWHQIHNPNAKYEEIIIPYDDENGKNRIYFVDFVDHENKVITEIKPKFKMIGRELLKMYAGRIWAKNNGYSYVWLKDDDFKGIRLKTFPDELKEQITVIPRKKKITINDK